MKTYIQSVSVDELRRLSQANLLDGVALTVTDLAAAEPEASTSERITEIGQAFAVPICVPVTSLSPTEIYREGRDLARASEHVVVQIPFVEDAIVPIRRLVAEGVRVCATYIYNGAQAYLAAKIGATIVMVPVDDVDAHGQPSAQIVHEIRQVIDDADLECELGVSSPRGATHFTGCLLAGADLACMTPDTVRAMMLHALTDRGVDRFMGDAAKRARQMQDA
jgi:transaldolase